MVTNLSWSDYLESDEFETKELFDEDIKSSDGLEIITSSPTITLYTTTLYPKSRFLVALGDLEEAVKSLPVDPTRATFIKSKLPELEHSLIEKVFDSYDITYQTLHKKPIDSLDLEPIDNDEVANLYIANHTHHRGINKQLLKERIDAYDLQELNGEGFTIYLEDQGDSFETSFFSTDGTGAGKEALLKQLKELGSFEMELDSTLKEFKFLNANLDEYCTYSCSSYKILDMTLTLSSVVDNPALATYQITLDSGEKVSLRTLHINDISKLDAFLEELSEQTRTFILPPGSELPSATKLCEDINKGDKLRFVVETIQGSDDNSRIIALLEFSFKLPNDDIERFESAGYGLNENTDSRFGPTIADDYQNTGLGGKLFPYVVEIARNFGKKRIILWDGVLKENERAVHYFEKNGFKPVGTFIDEGDEMIDMILEIE